MKIAAARQQNAGSWAVPLAVLIVGMFMSVLDTSIVNVAIPHIQTELGASSSDVEWVVTGYTLTLGVVVPISSWLTQRIAATTYANTFLIVAWLCAIGVVLALLLRNGQPTPATPTQTTPTRAAPVSIDPVSIDPVSIDTVPTEPVREPVPVGAGRRELPRRPR